MQNINSPQLRWHAVQAALGNQPFDLLLTNAQVLDMATGEVRAADIGIVGPLIASVHPQGQLNRAKQVHSLDGAYVSPGLIDSHVHVESSHMLPHQYANAVLPNGTTTIFWDPHELANVLGMDGVRYAIESSKGLPLRMLIQAPSCVPSMPGLEQAGAEINGKEMQTLLSWPEVEGVAEVMDMHGVLHGSQRMQDIINAGLCSGKLIEGHARGLKGETLQAYLAAGVSADHELMSAEDALEKLRAGLTLEIRSSHYYLLPEFAKALQTLPYLSSQITLCTDDIPPDLLLEIGGMIEIVRQFVKHGLPAIDVLRMATFNAAQHLKHSELGLVAAGRVADLVVFDHLEKLNPLFVYTAGQLVAQGGKMVKPAQASVSTIAASNTMHVQKTSPADFEIKVPGVKNGWARFHIIKGCRITEWAELRVQVKNGVVQLPKGISLIAVKHRHGKHDLGVQLAMMEGWGDIQGAIATSYSHDSHNMVILGKNPEDMSLAANTLIANGGGMVVCKNKLCLAEVPMPVAGMLSDLAPEELASQFANLREVSAQVVNWEPPMRIFKNIEGTCLACNAGPHLTDLGLTDGGTREIVSQLIDFGHDED